MIKVNGKNYEVENIALSEFLEEHGYDCRSIAVECNEEIVPKSNYAAFILHSGDVLEIVSFVGGG